MIARIELCLSHSHITAHSQAMFRLTWTRAHTCSFHTDAYNTECVLMPNWVTCLSIHSIPTSIAHAPPRTLLVLSTRAVGQTTAIQSKHDLIFGQCNSAPISLHQLTGSRPLSLSILPCSPLLSPLLSLSLSLSRFQSTQILDVLALNRFGRL
jgi:hypothetical protein